MGVNSRGRYAVILATIMLCIVASLRATSGQDKGAGGLRIATVDAQRLLQEYSYTNVADGDLQKKQNDVNLVLRTMQSNPLLTDKDQQELSEITTAQNTPAGITDAQKNRLKQLNDQSKNLLDEFETLKNKKVQDVTPQDNARLTQLIKLASDTDARLRDKKAKSDEDLQKQLQTVTTKVQKDIRDAIAKVAQAKGFNLVLNNTVALYAETDLTDPVLVVLNKK